MASLAAAMRFGQKFIRVLGHLRLQDSLRQAQIHFNRAQERHHVATLDQKSREIVDVQITDQVGLIFDIDPGELHLRMALRQRLEILAIFATTAAPGSAQTSHNPAIDSQDIGQFVAIVVVESKDLHARYFTASVVDSARIPAVRQIFH